MKFIPQVMTMAIFVMVSCSSDNEDSQNDIYLKIPDQSFETMLVDQGIDSDGLVNQRMLKTDAEEITVLDVSFSGKGTIMDLTGIEGFVNLKKLSVAQHELEQIDLSSNTQLDTLYLMGNYLTSIDVGNNPNLISLDLKVNSLSSITGLSKANQLKDLRLSFNLFEEISIHNPSLENLLMSHNELTSLDIEGAVNLKNILLRLNKVKELDLSSNVALENVFVDNNKLETINFGTNVNYKYLNLHNNLLSELDVSEYKELIKITINNNPDLGCVKIDVGQEIPTIEKSENQEFSSICE
ncbi:leucine-rich repeat domain-containing protein [Flagellimonas flava]|uniref:Leucine Rich repeat-containing protein n=1 Tax=Flagellimonas flava TaxID=570519 RepID=A0A1M5KYQ9_9FLAO|nr:hypothetical protein [Allomuricauda flava]SHG57876.1 hypothetical protein SAMN04488116_1858 [Allomuricauda flava]